MFFFQSMIISRKKWLMIFADIFLRFFFFLFPFNSIFSNIFCLFFPPFPLPFPYFDQNGSVKKKKFIWYYGMDYSMINNKLWLNWTTSVTTSAKICSTNRWLFKLINCSEATRKKKKKVSESVFFLCSFCKTSSSSAVLFPIFRHFTHSYHFLPSSPPLLSPPILFLFFFGSIPFSLGALQSFTVCQSFTLFFYFFCQPSISFEFLPAIYLSDIFSIQWPENDDEKRIEQKKKSNNTKLMFSIIFFLEI